MARASALDALRRAFSAGVSAFAVLRSFFEKRDFKCAIVETVDVLLMEAASDGDVETVALLDDMAVNVAG